MKTTALITGASYGIGEAFARELARQKYDLILVARSQHLLKDLAEELSNQYQIKVHIIVKDLTIETAVSEIYQEIQSQQMTVDMLINNAGFGDFKEFVKSDRDKQLKMIKLNVLALVELTHYFLPLMRSQGQGTILNIASIAAFQPLPYLSVYAATKAFVLSFSDALWAENQGTGVKILAVCPGPTTSKFAEVADFPESSANIAAGTPIETPESVVKEALAALNSNQSNIVTGGLFNKLSVNGHRFLPREFLTSLTVKLFKKNLGQ